MPTLPQSPPFPYTTLFRTALKENFHFLEAKQVSKFCLDKFENGEVDKVSVVFTDFINTLSQVPRVRTGLPITDYDLGDVLRSEEHTSELQSPCNHVCRILL